MSEVPLPENCRRIVTSHTTDGVSNIQIDSPMVWRDVPAFKAKASTIYVTQDSLPTNDNNSTEDGATRQLDEDNLGLTPKDGPGANVGATMLAPGGLTAMHRSSSQDYNVLVQGEIVLIMEDGSETYLKTPGDTIVMKGGLHAWRNPSKTEWARWVTVLTSAEPVLVGGKSLLPSVQ